MFYSPNSPYAPRLSSIPYPYVFDTQFNKTKSVKSIKINAQLYNK